MIPKLIWRWQTSSSALTKLCALEVQKMFCVERSDGPDIWFKEQCFESEFKAFTNARAKSLNTFELYRVVYESPGHSGEVLRISKGRAILAEGDRLVG
tara:strand:- start:14404 stop:14697 length:294 start_codon:yes stop_codon:yes gene_type:complete